jgi:hypothetical protein
VGTGRVSTYHVMAHVKYCPRQKRAGVQSGVRQAQPDVASPTAISATVARKVEPSLASRPACVFVASIETSVHVLAVREELSIQLLAKPQPKASANSNAEPGNAGLSLPRVSYRLPARSGCRSPQIRMLVYLNWA